MYACLMPLEGKHGGVISLFSFPFVFFFLFYTRPCSRASSCAALRLLALAFRKQSRVTAYTPLPALAPPSGTHIPDSVSQGPQPPIHPCVPFTSSIPVLMSYEGPGLNQEQPALTLWRSSVRVISPCVKFTAVIDV